MIVPKESLRAQAVQQVADGHPLVLMYATDERKSGGAFHVHAVFSVPGSGFVTLRADLDATNPRYPSVTHSVMAAHWYERQIRDQFGIEPEGHPDLRRLQHHENIPEGTYPMRKDFAWNTKLAHASVPYPMHRVEGKGIFEIPVGPIHAGIIEPGHFRFNVRGERILTLEGKLFFKHKGVEKIVEGKTPDEALAFVERVSGNMVVGHTLAYVQAVEAATTTVVSDRTRYLRTLYNELERITMHVFDIGNMAGMGTGFTFMAAQCFRLVEDLRRLHTELTGHRFLRGAVTLGGARDVSVELQEKIRTTLKRIEVEMEQLVAIAYQSDGLMERFDRTGVLTLEAARAYGAQGVAARASGVLRDERIDHPYAAYSEIGVSLVSRTMGDVGARFRVRVKELRESFRIVTQVLDTLPAGAVQVQCSARAGEGYGVSEAWLGGVLDWVRLDAHGKIDRLVIRDPSFCNWALFGELAPGNIVPDFPLCNKSLNLSYSGTDL
jgi:Ni,Fe-hydrogenase III large subunit/Ni,Fe-hydrogenase III component G